MAVVQAILSLVILGILYYRMIVREKPSQIGWLQALLPVGFGMASVFVSFFMFIVIAVLMSQFGLLKGGIHIFVKSVISAFLMAGGPEELAKLIFMAAAIFIFRKKIRNVYEYILIGAAVGIGFTLPEEFIYGDAEGQALWLRLLTIAGHMTYGMIMARHIGLAHYQKKYGQPRFMHYVLAVCVPVLLHTLYDACTSNNLMMLSENEAESDAGILLGLIGAAAHIVIQIAILLAVKKRTEKYCAMTLL